MSEDEVNPDRRIVDELKYSLANPRGLVVSHTKKVPLFEQKIRITDAEDFTKAEIFKLHELNCELTIIDARPLVMGDNGVYYYEYNVITREFPNTVIKGWNFEFIAKGL